MKRFQEKCVLSSGRFTVDSAGRVWRGSRRAEKRAGKHGKYLQVSVMYHSLGELVIIRVGASMRNVTETL